MYAVICNSVFSTAVFEDYCLLRMFDLQIS